MTDMPNTRTGDAAASGRHGGAHRAGRDPQDDPNVRAAQEERLMRAWKVPQGWRYWSAVNNSEVGKWYTASALFFFLFAGVLALIMRAQLAVPENTLVSADFYNQAMTLHGSMMMFLFAVPIFEAVAILLLPEMLGCRDLPFPRLSAFGFWCFLIGGIFVAGSIFFGAAPAGGWFMYPPLSTDLSQSGIGADIWLLGLSFIEIASIAAAVELIVGVLKCRPPGMRLNLMPLYAWYVLVVGAMIVFAFPPLIAGDLLFEMQRAFDWPFFDASRGGDPILWQHLFWIFGHPEVYIIFLPSVAILAMVIPTFCRVPVFGYSWIVLSAVGTGFISFGLWAHHMYTTGLPSLSLGYFSAASSAVAIPTGVQIFALIATVFSGRPRNVVPMLYAGGALAIFVLGGLTGVMVAMAPFDWQAHDSYFVVAHLHYVLIGGVVFPLVAGVYYYYPLVFKWPLSETLGRISFWLLFAGFNIAFLPMHLTGLKGMPRRVASYPDGLGWDWLNLVSTVGAFILAAGFLVIVYDVLRPKRHEPRAARNIWNAGTLEWAERRDGPPWGSRCVPRVESRYPLWDDGAFLKAYDEGRFYLNDSPHGARETLVTSVVEARPVQCLQLPGPAWIMQCAALFLGGVFILATFKLYIAAVVSGVLATAAIIHWLWTGTGRTDAPAERDVGLGLVLPTRLAGPQSVSWWALAVTMTADMVAFISLVFAYLYFWSTTPAFPPPGAGIPSPELALAAAALATAAWLATVLARGANRRNDQNRVRLLLATGLSTAALAVAALVALPLSAGLDPTAHAYQATVWIIVLWTGAHFGVGILMHGYVIARSAAGFLRPGNAADIWNTTLYWHFMLATAALALVTVAGLPHLTAGGAGP